MNEKLKILIKSYSTHFRQRDFLISFFASLAMITFALIINFYAGTYATLKASNSVTDLVLNNIRAFAVNGLFVEGTFYFFIFSIIICLLYIKRFPFIFKSVSLFIVVRAFFINLTHIAPFPSQIFISPLDMISKFSFAGDLFFSGHTGIPFLLALIFWDIKPLRFIFLGSSVFFATVVLLGHLHYSIDVFSAFFITYTLYHISKILFKKDLNLFENDIYIEVFDK
ncbi:MAG: phosphatase PAP2-related protein [Candidatus Nomurabacteria bacterium]|nr:phosphatase PAP2-related protein [Candidatus Nomurabacteria bacterium]